MMKEKYMEEFQMQYRKFGNTGEQISALGFGCMRFPEYEADGKMVVDTDKVDEMIAEAYRRGVNYFDTAPYYCNHHSEAALGHAVKEFRDQILLSSKFPCDLAKKPGDYRRQVERSLEQLGTDHIDFYHFWGIDREDFDNIILAKNLLEEAQQAKEEGLIRHISFSFHDDPSAIKYIVDTAESRGIPFESMLCQYNLLDRSNEQMISYAQSKGLGTVAMGPVGGGRLAAPTEMVAKLTGGASIPTYALAFKFVLGHPDLNCALSGMQNTDMVRKNTELASGSIDFSQEEWERLGKAMEDLKKFSELYCTGCKYCQPCPAGIEIPKLFNMYTYYNVYGLTEHAKKMFDKFVADGGKLSDACLNCGKCEHACPQHLQIRENLRMVESVLKG